MFNKIQNLVNFIKRAMKKWRVEPTAGRQFQVKIKSRCIFKREALFSLQFVIEILHLKKYKGSYKFQMSLIDEDN